MTYRPDIDGLRALAVVSVLLCHVGLSCSGGFVGVDVFFVISGYLIARLMLKEIAAGTFSLVDFWERRIRRILPALAVVVAGSFVAGWFLLVPSEYRAFGRSVVSLAIVQANIFFSHEVGYFAPAAEEKPLLHTWSLAVEEQFYLVVPLLFLGAIRLRGTKFLTSAVAMLMLASFAANVVGTANGDPQSYYWLSTRAWELLCGTATAFVAGRRLIIRPAQREFAAALGLLGIVLPVFLYDQSTPFPGFAALPPVLATALLIHLGEGASQSNTARPTTVHRLLALRPVVFVGLISYSLYLWHWPLLVFLKRHNIVELTLAQRFAVVAGSLVLAAITYRFVERPFRRRDPETSRRLAFGGAGAAFACLLIAGLVVRGNDGFPDRLPEQARRFADSGRMDRRYLRELTSDDMRRGLPRVGATNVEPRLLVWGDSHAMAVLPTIDAECRASGLAAEAAVHSGWPPLLKHSATTVPHRRDEADAFSAAVIAHVEAGRTEAVVLAACWSLYEADPEFAASLLATVERLHSTGVRVYFLKDVPKFSFDVAAVLTRQAWRNRDPAKLTITAAEYEAQNPIYAELLPELERREVVILDPIPFLVADKSSGTIRPFDSAGSFYRDAGHLSMHGAERIRPAFDPLIADLKNPNANAATTATATNTAPTNRTQR